jgi:hypothetical protein
VRTDGLHHSGLDHQPDLRALNYASCSDHGEECEWEWVETELGGPWADAGTSHYHCLGCGAMKSVKPDGSEEIWAKDDV